MVKSKGLFMTKTIYKLDSEKLIQEALDNSQTFSYEKEEILKALFESNVSGASNSKFKKRYEHAKKIEEAALFSQNNSYMKRISQ